MSVLAHVVLKGSLPSEPAATQALAHILNASPDIARAFLGMLRQAEIEFELGHIQAELGHEDICPDLTIHDDHGRVRAFVENKFWAGLTDAQPVSYLGDLPEDLPAALLFIVPQQRVTTVWNELKLRCGQAELEWRDGPGTRTVTWSRVGRKTLLITSWTHVLEGLLDAAHSGEHDSIRHDILQLRGLTSRMDSEAFLPIRADEVTDQGTAHRLVNYIGLIEDITHKLRDSGIADTRRLRPAHAWYTIGRYLRVHERFGLWLGIDLEVWREAGITPLWWIFNDGEFSGVAGRLQTIRELFDDVQYYEDAGTLYIPIRLKTSVERDRVVEDAVAQMSRIAHTLLESFPDKR